MNVKTTAKVDAKGFMTGRVDLDFSGILDDINEALDSIVVLFICLWLLVILTRMVIRILTGSQDWLFGYRGLTIIYPRGGSCYVFLEVCSCMLVWSAPILENVSL